MGFFGTNKDKKASNEGKDSEKIELPKLPSLPDLPGDNKPLPNPKEPVKTPTLPSFPNSHLGEKINQDTVKAAINREGGKPGKMEIPTMHSKPITKPRMTPSIMSLPPMPKERKVRGNSKPRVLEMSDFHTPVSEPSRVSGADPLFIKLDTFEKAISNFNEIKLRVSEVETLLGNILELKAREDRELSDWETEIETIKARLEQIDHEIFERMQ